MSEGATAAFWVGTAAEAVMTCIYAYFSFFPRREGSHTVAIWMLAPAIFLLVSQSSLIIDVGGTIRSDAVEYNFERWIAFTVAILGGSAVIAAYNWFDLIDGWWLMAFGTMAGVFTTVAGVATQNRQWPLFSAAILFIIVWAVWMIWKSRRTALDPSRTTGSKVAGWILSIGFILITLLTGATFMFSDALIGSMSFPLATWLYMACAIALVVLPIIAVFDYHSEEMPKTD